ncbi:MAG: acetyl-CoA acetyltransferase [Acidimicrobiia bacterium]|nr:acetyl-CoA acetyltransferase [Acidimicrobiia bacterium]
MPAGDDTPVLVGVGQIRRRPEDGPVPSLVELMLAAVQRAATDAGRPGLLGKVGWIGAPKGTWTHPDPGREIGRAIGAPDAHTVVAEVGVLQQEVIDRACRAVVDGAGVAIVVGGEVAHGSTDGAAGSVVAARGAVTEPDEHLVSADMGVSALEVQAALYDPPTVYAVMESAWAHSQGWDASEHRRRLGALWADFAAVAARNPYAWTTDAPSASEIVEPTADNRMIASPYTKRCCSNLRVNQSAALVITTAEVARGLGVRPDRWVFAHAGAVCNHAVPVVQRPDLARSAVAASAGPRALELAGVDVDELGPLDLYSCFPVAVQIAAHELGLGDRRPLTLTGGMNFAGGPLNSYVLHSTAAMADALRAAPDQIGLDTSVSGFITKYGAGVWSAQPPKERWRAEATSIEVDRRSERAAEPGEEVRVVGATVEHRRDGSRELVAVGDLASGERTIVRTTDAATLDAALAETLIGETIRA